MAGPGSIESANMSTSATRNRSLVATRILSTPFIPSSMPASKVGIVMQPIMLGGVGHPLSNPI